MWAFSGPMPHAAAPGQEALGCPMCTACRIDVCAGPASTLLSAGTALTSSCASACSCHSSLIDSSSDSFSNSTPSPSNSATGTCSIDARACCGGHYTFAQKNTALPRMQHLHPWRPNLDSVRAELDVPWNDRKQKACSIAEVLGIYQTPAVVCICITLTCTPGAMMRQYIRTCMSISTSISIMFITRA